MNGLFSSVMSAAWKPVRSFYDGASGTTHLNGAGKAWKNKHGENVVRNPYGKLVQRLKSDAKQVVTGKKYNPATGQELDKQRSWLGRQTLGRVGGVMHGVGDLTLGGAATTLGWGARGATKLAGKAVSPLVQGAGHLAYQGVRDTSQVLWGGAAIASNMSKTRTGSAILFGGGLAATAGVGLAATGLQETTQDRMQFYSNNQVESLPGTLGAQGASNGSDAMVDTGADGELVFALHNMR